MDGPCVLKHYPVDPKDPLSPPEVWQAWAKYPLTGYDDNVSCVLTMCATRRLGCTKPLLRATYPPAFCGLPAASTASLLLLTRVVDGHKKCMLCPDVVLRKVK